MCVTTFNYLACSHKVTLTTQTCIQPSGPYSCRDRRVLDLHELCIDCTIISKPDDHNTKILKRKRDKEGSRNCVIDDLLAWHMQEWKDVGRSRADDHQCDLHEYFEEQKRLEKEKAEADRGSKGGAGDNNQDTNKKKSKTSTRRNPIRMTRLYMAQNRLPNGQVYETVECASDSDWDDEEEGAYRCHCKMRIRVVKPRFPRT